MTRRLASMLALGSIAGLVAGIGVTIGAAPPAFARESTFNHWPPETFDKVGEEAAGVIEAAQAGDSFSGTIDWGDGATSPASIGPRHGHRYTKVGTYTVTARSSRRSPCTRCRRGSRCARGPTGRAAR
jgi:hypothetical protein